MINKYIKEFKKIWKDGDFTIIFIVSILTYIIVQFLPEKYTTFNNCIF